MVVSGLRDACPSHLTLWRLSSWEMGICPVTSSSAAAEGPSAPVPAHHAAHAGVVGGLLFGVSGLLLLLLLLADGTLRPFFEGPSHD